MTIPRRIERIRFVMINLSVRNVSKACIAFFGKLNFERGHLAYFQHEVDSSQLVSLVHLFITNFFSVVEVPVVLIA